MPTYTQIGSAVVVGGAGAATIDFSSIPSTYTDLVLKVSGRGTNAGNNQTEVNLSLNTSTSSFTSRYLYAFDTTVGSSTYTRQVIWITGDGAGANIFSNCEVYIPNYASSNYKSITSDNVNENNSTSNLLVLNAQLWSNTAAINQITLTPVSGNFKQYSTAYLYGVSNA